MAITDKIKRVFKKKEADPVAKTAGEQDHSDPWIYAGEPADPPTGDEE